MLRNYESLCILKYWILSVLDKTYKNNLFLIIELKLFRNRGVFLYLFIYLFTNQGPTKGMGTFKAS
jgi:hypothetical protein